MQHGNLIQVEQALHGYSDGHRLLASSIRPKRESERAMLILSDLSGDIPTGGLGSYLTGYPLPSDQLYAFANTWLAPEMPRPGCVWTHTLLIHFSDIAKLPDLRNLLGSFHRPGVPLDPGRYSTALNCKIDASSGLPAIPQPIHPLDASSVVFARYTTPMKPLVVVSDRLDELREILLGMWSQQWPELRRTFRFCTGAFSHRSVDGEGFDVEATPSKTFRRSHWLESGAQVLQHDSTIPQSIPAWAEEAGRDLQYVGRTQLRSRLWSLGEGISEAALFPVVMGVLAQAGFDGGKGALTRISKLVGDALPSSKDGVQLKLRVFGPPESRDIDLLNASEGDILACLSSTPLHAAFNIPELQVRSRGARYWRAEPNARRNLLGELNQQQLNPIAAEIMKGISSAITADEAASVAADARRIFPVLASTNPMLASIPEAWDAPPDDQRLLLDAVSRSELKSKDTLTRIVGAMLLANSDNIAEETVQQLGIGVVAAILEHINACVHSSLSQAAISAMWLRVLHSNSQEVLNWLKDANAVKPRTLLMVLELVSPRSKEARSISCDTWLRALKGLGDLPHTPENIKIMAFLLAVGLDSNVQGADELVARSFEFVHEAAAHSNAEGDWWKYFAYTLPHLWIWQEWDKCERLRRGLAESFVRSEWPISQLLGISDNPQVIRRIVTSFGSVRGGDSYLRKALSSQSSLVGVSEGMLKIVHEVLRSRSF